MELTPLTLAVAAWAVVRPPALLTRMVTVRTSRLPVLSSSVPVTAVTVPFSVSKVPSSTTSALWPTEKLAASAAGNSRFSSILELSRMTATSWPLVTWSPFATLRLLTVPSTSARTYWRSTVLS